MMIEVESVRSIDVDRLISELHTKANTKQEDKKVKGKFYEVVVNRQLLVDACDALKHYRKQEVNTDTSEDDLK